MKINRDNIDELYERVNKLIDKYFEHDINPQSLDRYLKLGGYGINKFIHRNELDDIDSIEKLIRDVVEDRLASSEKKIKKFESFINESYVEYTDNQFNFEYEISVEERKIVADKYRVSFGLVQSENYNSNILNVRTIAKDITVVIINTKKAKSIIKEVAESLFREISTTTHSSRFIDIEVDMHHKVHKGNFINKTVMDLSNRVIDIIISILTLYTSDNYKFVGDNKSDKLLLFEKI